MQMDVVMSFVSGKDVFVVQPTGSGKSLCYICLPLVFKKLASDCSHPIVVVVSPLISLMKDQVEKYSRLGIKCASVVRGDERIEKNAAQGLFDILFASPEALLTTKTWRGILSSELYRKNVVALVVDEAHCIHMW